MTVVMGTNSRSGSRTKAPSRLSLNRLRHGSSGGQGSSMVGGQPLAGADPAKKDIKHRFEITRKLGSGTYGKVSLAYDHKTEREVAVKLIKKSAIENKQDLVRIRREIRIMSMLKHPNIIEIYEVFENKDKIILVMEYASGGELYDYVSKFGSLPEAEARRIFRQITSAVLYCHKHKVAHRDLKLENILLDINNNAKIADFGLSNYFNDKSLLNTFCGSPLYASPEIINGTPYHGPEVDCWSLGILLYTLVYGSMPFDGHDFNRMVRQIKRGTYYEPETPSTASMLIRNMLRVNPDRRADIDDIASHWWLNLEENMPVIQELPENQITDYTPLTERAEVLYVQDLADETDVFMEFGHLSSATRQKIEEFRRRRKEAEEYNENCPIKPPKRKTDDKPEMSAKEKSLRHQETEKKEKPSDFTDPLERLRQLENRLHTKVSSASPDRPSTSKEVPQKTEPEEPPESPKLEPAEAATDQKPAFVSPTETKKPAPHKPLPFSWKHETDSLNVLMNQLLEQMDKGPVSMNLVARVKAHPMYEHRPTIKELLESIIAAQPDSVQKQASKVIEHACNTLKRESKGEKTPVQSPVSTKAPPTAPAAESEKPSTKQNKYAVSELPTVVDVKAAISRRGGLEERKWHSVEVGFDTDEESSSNSGGSRKNSKVSVEPKFMVRDTKSAGHALDEEDEGNENLDEECEDESEYESEIDELAEVVEQVGQSGSQLPNPPTIVESLSEAVEAPAPSEISANHLSTLERRLAKRQSKGKYQHNYVELYGRGVSTEADSPPPAKKPIGGPQPSVEQCPVLFDKATKLIMEYPAKANDEEVPKQTKKWTKTQDPDVSDKSASATPIPTRKLDARDTIPEGKVKVAKPRAENNSEEESEDEGEPIRKPRTSMIIGFRTIKTTTTNGSKEAPIVEVKPQKPYQGINPAQRSPSQEKPKENCEPPPETTTPTSPSGRFDYESAAMYIRRKNRERRARTLTIAITDEAWQRVAERTPQPAAKSPTEKTETDARTFANKLREPPIRRLVNRQTSKGSGDPPQQNYHRNSYLEDRRQSYSERRKSFHDFDQLEQEDSSTNYNTKTALSNYVPGSRFEFDDVPSRPTQYTQSDLRYNNPSLFNSQPSQSWGMPEAPRNRFEVYQTRAERDRQAAGSSTTNYYNDRPSNSYMASSSIKPQYTDYTQGLRRPSAFESELVGSSDYMLGGTNNIIYGQSAESYSKDRFRPVTRRLGPNAKESENRKGRARSQSSDRKFSTGAMSEFDAVPSMSNRLMTPEVGTGVTDYGYVSYHDSSNARTSQPREPDISLAPTRSILKNKQAYEMEPRALQQRDHQAWRRSALSMEKGGAMSGPMYASVPFGPIPRHGSIGAFNHPAVVGPAEVPRAWPQTSTEVYEPLSTASAKKRNSGPASFLNLRRRTAEIRLGNDGKMSTISNGIHIDDDYKRPRSPIDRIKSFFGGSTAASTSKKPTSTSTYSANGSSRYGSALPTSQFKRYGGGAWF